MELCLNLKKGFNSDLNSSPLSFGILLQKPSTPPYQDNEITFKEAAYKPSESKRIRDEIVLAPYRYIKSLPGKGVRDILINALDVWLRVSERSLGIIKEVVDLLHTSSLMFDDIEDSSALRRGKPTAHRIFGIGQTINSSTYVLISSITSAQKLSNKDCVSIVTEEVSNMLRGQSIDLHTTYFSECPSEAEYLDMIDNKTGALFRIAYRLMQAESIVPSLPDFEPLLLLLGRYFQIRDDYLNLVSEEYTGKKGFCEDLDEGKFSFPLIHCLLSPHNPSSSGIAPRLELQNIFMTRNRSGHNSLSEEMKHHVLGILNSTSSLEYTRLALDQLDGDLQSEIARVEMITASENLGLRGLIKKLKI